MKTAESKTTTTAATTAAKTPTAAFFSQEPQRAAAFLVEKQPKPRHNDTKKECNHTSNPPQTPKSCPKEDS